MLTGAILTRTVLAALGLLLTLFAVLSIGGAQRASRQADAVGRSGEIVRAHLRAYSAFSVEDEVEDVLDDAPSAALLARFDAAAASMERALAFLERRGGRNDAALARRARPVHRSFVLGMRRQFALLGRGQEDEAELVKDRLSDPAQDELQPLINGTSPTAAIAQLAQLDVLKADQRARARQTTVAAIVGVLLYGLLVAIFVAYRRRLDRSTRAELDALHASLKTDRLTGLPNHRAFHDDLDAEAGRLGDRRLVVLDVIGLRELNHGEGHHAGDERLAETGAALTAVADRRGHPRAYRIGGNELALLFGDATSAWEVRDVVEGLIAAGVPVRAGIAGAEVAAGKEELARRAYLAAAAARRLGQRIVLYSPDLEATDDPADETAEPARTALVSALAQAVDAKDPYTRSHCEVVSSIATLVAQELGLDPAHVARVRLAGLLHDVGKIGVPDSTLHKDGPLDEREWTVMRTHAKLGSDVLAAAGLEREAGWVLHHHERVDGTGYPHGLFGDEIPLEARIVFCADTFEAITSDRPYRLGRPPEVALAEIRRCAGTQFDPVCAAALERVLGGGGAQSADADADADAVAVANAATGAPSRATIAA